ncbi:MAG: hypothetical protein Q9170_006339 [Blastenia crenularia]
MATNVDAKLLKQTKFPPEFNQKIDMKKVNVEVMKKWIAGKISEILGSEDDVVIELCFNLLEGSRFPDIKVLQIQLTGFLDKDTPKFCKELWTLCLSAQSNPQGVPKELLEAKKLELIQEKIDAEKAAEQAQHRKEQERTREKNIDNIRHRERAERGRGRGRGDRFHHEYDRRPSRDSRSPPPRRRQSPYRDDYRGPPRRDFVDTYVPSGRNERPQQGRRRSPSPRRAAHRSISRSITPPRRRQQDTPASIEAAGEIAGEGVPAVVVIGLDPTHFQIRPAHDPPDRPEEGGVLLLHPAALLLPRSRAIPSTGTMYRHLHQYLGPALDEATVTIGAVAVAVAVAVPDTRTLSLLRKLRAGAVAHRSSEKERDIAQLSAMHQLLEDGVTLLQSLHPLRSVIRWLILLRKKQTGSPQGPSAKITRMDRPQRVKVKRSPSQTANALREKLLREKVMALRKASAKHQSTQDAH